MGQTAMWEKYRGSQHRPQRRRQRITSELEYELLRDHPELVARMRRRRRLRRPGGKGGWLHLWYLVLSLTACVAVGAYLPDARAAGEADYREIHQARTGTLLFVTADQHYRAALRLDTEVAMTISGLVVEAKVRQTFRNDGGEWAEGIYVFPLPENAAVNALTMQVGERVIVGEIKPRATAKQVYQQAKAAGKRASLVEQERPNIFTTSVANIAPGESIAVEITYLQTLRYDQGEFSLRVPLTITPRFIPGAPLEVDAAPLRVQGATGWAMPTDQVPDAPRITPPVLIPEGDESRAHFPVASVAIRLNPGFALADLRSESHPIAVQEQHGVHRITLRDGPVRMERDFVLRWRPELGRQPQAALFTERFAGQEYALLMVMPPPIPADEVRIPREVMFILDTSGSMGGPSIVQAKAALSEALQRLQPQDRFNVIEFNDTTRRLYSTPMAAAPERIAQAVRRVVALDADGGTLMAPAIELALQGQAPRGYLRQVIFITDGAVGNERPLFQLVRERLGDSRLFTIGIGPAPNSYFMREAARMGRGTFTHIGNSAEVGEKIGRLFVKLEQPLLARIRLRWPQGTQVEVWPAIHPDLYQGEPVLVSAQLDRLEGELRIEGMTGQAPWRRTLALRQSQHSPGVAALWAREKIRYLMHKGPEDGARDTLRETVTAIAMKHQLVSRYTSLVAVDAEAARPAQAALATKPVPSPLPQGSTLHTVSLPRTATPAALHLLIGAALAIVAWLLLAWNSLRAPSAACDSVAVLGRTVHGRGSAGSGSTAPASQWGQRP